MKIISKNKLRDFGVPFSLAIFFFCTISFFRQEQQISRVDASIQPNRTDLISCSPGESNDFFDRSLEEVTINDNRQAAGEFRNGIYYIDLEARTGYWYPETRDGAAVKIKAFAETGKPLQVPGPLIRVPEGTEIRARVRNRNKEPLVLYGFISRPGNFRDSVVISEGEVKEINFNAGAPGTYLYAVRDTGDKLVPPAIIAPFLHSQLYGAFIVDPANAKIDPKERIFMIGICGVQKDSSKILTEYVMNGLSWPYTERLTYSQGEAVNWRVINASILIHPMHLHGFPFTVTSYGTPGKDSIVSAKRQRRVVTQMLSTISNAMKITWVPDRKGNWLFHCHLLDHVMPESFLRKQAADHAAMNLQTHAQEGMGGLMIGIQVTPNEKFPKPAVEKKRAERQLTLMVGEQPNNYFHNAHGKGFQLLEKGTAASKPYQIPGPPIILTRDQPVAIKVVNTMKVPTTIHWHGLEIENYYDGAAGWGTDGKNLAPLIQPGDSFTVHITPPRAGTFIYHTHMHDQQLLDGLYGALIVMEPGESFNPEKDKILVISQGGSNMVFTNDWNNSFSNVEYLLNGSQQPEPISLKKGSAYRLRVINIIAQEGHYFTSRQSGLYIALTCDNKPASWKIVDIDGMNLPERLHEIMDADRFRAGPGTTKDFEFKPDKAGNYRFEVIVDGKLQVSQMIKVEN